MNQETLDDLRVWYSRRLGDTHPIYPDPNALALIDAYEAKCAEYDALVKRVLDIEIQMEGNDLPLYIDGYYLGRVNHDLEALYALKQWVQEAVSTHE